MNIAIYARVSSETQAKEGTIDSQIEALRDYAKSHELTIVHEFIDNGYSGSELNRPGLDQLRDAIQEGQVEAVLILSPDRLSRKQAHQIILLEEFKKRNAQILFTNLSNKDSPEDQLMLQIQGAVSEYERSKILDRMRRGTKHSVLKGQVLGNFAPYGYRFVRKSASAPAHWEVNPDEAEIIKVIFDCYVRKGYKGTRIAKLLQEEGIQTRAGITRWEPSVIYAILRSETYIGTAYMFKHKAAEPRKNPKLKTYRRYKNSSMRARPREDWISIPVTPIINLQVWQRAQELLKQNAHQSRRNNIKNQYLLRGLVLCGLCGSFASGYVSHKHTYYSCVAKRNKNVASKPHDETIAADHRFLDERVWNGLTELLSDPDNLKAQVEKRLDAKKLFSIAPDTEHAKIDKDAERLGIQEQRVLDAYREGIITMADLREQKSRIAARRKILETKKKTAPSQQKRLGQPEITLAMLGDVSARYRHVMAKANFATKEKLANLLINSVTLYPKKAVVEGNIPVIQTDVLNPSALRPAHIVFPGTSCQGRE